jgi:LysR family hydrogen peroxide-inducible transcriptional activator
MIEENFTGNLAPMLREGALDVVIIALPFSIPGVRTKVVYEEPFSVVVPKATAGAGAIPQAERARRREPARPQRGPLLSRPGARGVPGPVEHGPPGGPLRKLARNDPQHGGVGPRRERAAGDRARPALLVEAAESRSFTSPSPSRKVALAWRTSFDRPLAVETLAAAMASIKMPCLKMAKAAA